MISALPEIISEVEKRCRPNTLVSLFLDFDGTLVPIAPDPATPRLDEQTREALSLITAKPSFATTIISGRAVEDLFTRIRLEGLIYAGNHGLEIFGRNLCFVEPTAAALRDRLAHLSEHLAELLHDIPGALVEYKGLTTSVHYRQVSEAEVVTVQDLVHNVVAANGSFRANTGRKVIEIVPPVNWHKGEAARWIIRRFGRDERDVVSIYFGDDSTDEHAFSTLSDAVTVRVGGCQASSAKYHVPGPESVHQFLHWLVKFEPHTGRASACPAL